MHVLVDMDGVWVSGFACGSCKSCTLGSTSVSGQCPYKADICPESDVCGKQVLSPIWYCRACFECEDGLTGQSPHCKWSIGGDNTS